MATDDLAALPTVDLGQLHAAAKRAGERARTREQFALGRLRAEVEAGSDGPSPFWLEHAQDLVAWMRRASAAEHERDAAQAEWVRRCDFYRARTNVFVCAATYSGDPVHLRCEATQVRAWAALCEEHAPQMSFDVPTCVECCRRFDETLAGQG